MPSYSFKYAVGEQVKLKNAYPYAISDCIHSDYNQVKEDTFEYAQVVRINVTKNKYTYDVLLEDRLEIYSNISEDDLINV